MTVHKVKIPPLKTEGPVGGDLSVDGTEVLIKTYNHIYYWKSRSQENLRETLGRYPDKEVPYNEEPQGEAVAWDPKTNGYYTLSENVNQPIWFYKKLR